MRRRRGRDGKRVEGDNENVKPDYRR
jgi:hypothetical protein